MAEDKQPKKPTKPAREYSLHHPERSKRGNVPEMGPGEVDRREHEESAKRPPTFSHTPTKRNR